MTRLSRESSFFRCSTILLTIDSNASLSMQEKAAAGSSNSPNLKSEAREYFRPQWAFSLERDDRSASTFHTGHSGDDPQGPHERTRCPVDDCRAVAVEGHAVHVEPFPFRPWERLRRTISSASSNVDATGKSSSNFKCLTVCVSRPLPVQMTNVRPALSTSTCNPMSSPRK